MIIPAIATALAATAGVVSAVRGFSQKEKMPDLAPMPQAPVVGDADAKAKDQMQAYQAKRKGRSSTILTGSSGVLEQAPIATKTLLGE